MLQFTKAIVRQPGRNFSGGITTSKLGKPSLELALKQHCSYCDALKKCGLEVTILPADERFPDGSFVEDTAVVTNEVAIITKPGDNARVGEVEKIKEVLSKHKKIEEIELPGNVDGGDVMRVGNHFYVGMSKRTNLQGAVQLSEILSKYGYTSSQIAVNSVLHLKTGITYLGETNFISIDEFKDSFKNSNVIHLEPEEFYSANCLRVNDFLLVPKGFRKSKEKLVNLGYNLIEIEMSEFRKMDGGLTCLSLLF